MKSCKLNGSNSKVEITRSINISGKWIHFSLIKKCFENKECLMLVYYISQNPKCYYYRENYNNCISSK